MTSLDFSIDLILPAPLWHWAQRPAHKTDLTSIRTDCLKNVRASMFHNLVGLHSPRIVLILLYLISIITILPSAYCYQTYFAYFVF
jgi:hypothetical protein